MACRDLGAGGAAAPPGGSVAIPVDRESDERREDEVLRGWEVGGMEQLLLLLLF